MAITGAGGFLGQLARAECEDLFGTDLWGIGGKLLHVLFLLAIFWLVVLFYFYFHPYLGK